MPPAEPRGCPNPRLAARSGVITSPFHCTTSDGTMRKTLLSFIAVLAASAATAGAQMSNPVTDALRAMVPGASRNFVGSAEEMPADKYSYHPTEKQMTFGQLVLHVATSNEFLCSRISGAAGAHRGQAHRDVAQGGSGRPGQAVVRLLRERVREAHRRVAQRQHPVLRRAQGDQGGGHARHLRRLGRPLRGRRPSICVSTACCRPRRKRRQHVGSHPMARGAGNLIGHAAYE